MADSKGSAFTLEVDTDIDGTEWICIIDNTSTTPSDAKITVANLFKAMAPISWQTKVANYTLVLADQNKGILMNLAGANTLTIDSNANVPMPVGTAIPVIQIGAGKTTVAITTDTLNAVSGNKSLGAQYAGCVLYKVGTTSWIVAGNLIA